MHTLILEWRGWAAGCAAAVMLSAWGLSRVWEAEAALRWLIPAAGLMLYQTAYLRRYLGENVDQRSGRLFERLGPGNRLTLLRGALLALTAGFLFTPRPEGWLAWLPAALYLSAMLVDYVDGYAARVSGMATPLGSRLDMHFDVHGYLIGGALVVLWGQAPWWYLLVALARPLYVLGGWIWQRRGIPLRPLYANRFRRAMSGAQMGFTAVLLFPVFTPPGTTIAAAMYVTPFLTSFLLDWLWVSGTLPEGFASPGERRARLDRILRRWLPPALRLALAGVLLAHALTPGIHAPLGSLYAPLHAVIALAVLTGTAGRTFAVAAMLLSGLYLRADAGDGLAWAMLVMGLALFYTGTGRFSLWTPEDWLIFRIAGEKRDNPPVKPL